MFTTIKTTVSSFLNSSKVEEELNGMHADVAARDITIRCLKQQLKESRANNKIIITENDELKSAYAVSEVVQEEVEQELYEASALVEKAYVDHKRVEAELETSKAGYNRMFAENKELVVDNKEYVTQLSNALEVLKEAKSQIHEQGEWIQKHKNVTTK